jgi:bifunctional DNase/RNase
MLHKAIITDIMMDSNTNEPLIILVSETKSIKVAILLGVLEAISILSALAEIDFNLPTPHDLVKELLAHESIRVIPESCTQFRFDDQQVLTF